MDAEFAAQLKTARARLYPFKIGRKGDLQEWFKDWDATDPHHRHISHLMGLHPFSLITRNGTPELSQCLQALAGFARRREHRLVDGLEGKLLGAPEGRRPRLKDPHAIVHLIDPGDFNYTPGRALP